MDVPLWLSMTITHIGTFILGWLLGSHATYRLGQSNLRHTLDDLRDATEQDENSEWRTFFRNGE